MKSIDEDIKSGEFKNIYLLYGEEVYLKRQYKDKLIKSLTNEGDTMNFSSYEGKDINPKEIIDLAETMPFLAERRVILVENSGFFKSWLDKNESFNESSNRESIYDEPELLGKGYAAPTSIDYADEVKYKLKYNALEDLQNLQELMNATIARVEDFDEYWNAHKAAIMKNIKEAQDLIPTEYRA